MPNTFIEQWKINCDRNGGELFLSTPKLSDQDEQIILSYLNPEIRFRSRYFSRGYMAKEANILKNTFKDDHVITEIIIKNGSKIYIKSDLTLQAIQHSSVNNE